MIEAGMLTWEYCTAPGESLKKVCYFRDSIVGLTVVHYPIRSYRPLGREELVILTSRVEQYEYNTFKHPPARQREDPLPLSDFILPPK
jgi:hypothetical protein